MDTDDESQLISYHSFDKEHTGCILKIWACQFKPEALEEESLSEAAGTASPGLQIGV